MAEDIKKLTIRSTKQEMLAAYNKLVQELEQKREAELKPEQKAKEQKSEQVIERSDKLTLDGVDKEINNLKSEINRTLVKISEKLEKEISRYQDIKLAVDAKEKELDEIYEIQKSASSLAALIEAQNQRRKEFEREMAEKKQALTDEIETARSEWVAEKNRYEAQMKEKKQEDEKQRQREKEEYDYNFKREQTLAKDKIEDEKARVEKELLEKREKTEKELADRIRIVEEKEKKIGDLENRIDALEKQQDADVKNAIKATTDKLNADFLAKEALLKKEFEGERNVMTTRITALEELVKKQNDQITLLTQQADKASLQVQEIAVKAIEGSSHAKLFNQLQNLVEEKKEKSSAKAKGEL